MAGPRTVKPPLIDRVPARRAWPQQKPRPWRVETVRIPAPDGTGLGADIYTPLGRSKGVLLSRGPYGRGGMLALGAARMYAAQGYTVLFASSRGTADSGGVLDPTPAVGGNKLGGGGYKDDSELARRQDVLSYETSPLAADLTVMGSARLTLAHAMERPDGDLFVRVSDIDAAGRPRNVAETYQRVRGGPQPCGCPSPADRTC